MVAFEMKKVYSFIKLIGWSIIFYLFVFQPVISKYIYIFVEFLLFVYILFSHKKLMSNNFKLFRREYLFAGLICGYSFLMDASNYQIVYLDRFVASFFQGYLVSFILIFFISKYSYLQENLDKCLVMMCFIACSITIAAVLIPSVNDFCMEYATADIKNRFQELYIEHNFQQYRSYGLSENINFTYPYVLAIIGGYLITSQFKIYSPFIIVMVLVAVIFNARIAFVPLLIAVFYALVLKKKSTRGIISFALIAFFFIIIINWGLILFPNLRNEWGLSFFTEIGSYVEGEEDGTIGTLTNRMWIIPDDDLELIIGTGDNLFHNTAGRGNSDVGYILQLNYGGLILLSVILFYFFYISKRIIKALSLRHWFAIMFIVSIFVLNMKGFYLSAIPGNRFITFLYVYFVYASKIGIRDLTPNKPLISLRENYVC